MLPTSDGPPAGSGTARAVPAFGGGTGLNGSLRSHTDPAREPLPPAAVDQFIEGLALAGAGGGNWIGGQVRMADRDCADRRPLVGHAEAGAEIGDVRRAERPHGSSH